MKKNYFNALFILLFALLNYSHSAAQQLILATDDVADVTSGTVSQLILANVTANDSLFGNPVVFSDVILTQISTSNPAIQLQTDGSVLLSGGPIPDGSYVLNYQICVASDPGLCDIGSVTIFVGICHVDAPVAFIQNYLYCNSAGIVAVYGLPASTTWTLQMTKNGVILENLVGNGPMTFLSFTSAGVYGIKIVDDGNGCESPEVFVEFVEPPICGFYMWYNGTYNDFNANGLFDAGDTINYNFRITNNSSFVLSNISISSPTINVSGGPISTLASGAIDTTSFAGIYAITQNDIDLGFVNNAAIATATANSVVIETSYSYNFYFPNIRGIRMLAFVDTNSNGLWDGAENQFTNGQFQYEKNDDGNVHYASWSGGSPFIFENNPANSYDLSFTVNSQYAPYYTATTSSYEDVSVGVGITTYLFPVTEIPFIDAAVAVAQFGPWPRPGFPYNNIIFYSNRSNTTIASGTITFTTDNLLTILNISESGTITTPTGFTYDFTNLLPNESRYINVTLQVPTIPTVELGDPLTVSAQITIPPSDVDVLNNSSTMTSIIVGSYDPNDKTESHGPKIEHTQFSANDYLTYTIQFENTGTANAVNVSVNDVLDSKLDETTIRMVAASHSYVLDRVDNNLNWRFNAIDLPPSIPDTNTGKGYIVFQVKPKEGYAIGDIIQNTADIYFDFNPAIVTNVCNTEFVATLGVNEVNTNEFVVFPNPTPNKLNISNGKTAIDSLTLFDIYGKVVLSKMINNVNAGIDLAQLSNGLYFVTIKSDGNQHTIKVLKE